MNEFCEIIKTQGFLIWNTAYIILKELFIIIQSTDQKRGQTDYNGMLCNFK